MDFFMTVAAERVGPDSTLRKVGTLMDWQRLAAGGSRASLRHPEAALPGGSTPVQGTAGRGGETTLKAMALDLLKAAGRHCSHPSTTARRTTWP